MKMNIELQMCQTTDRLDMSFLPTNIVLKEASASSFVCAVLYCTLANI